MTLEILAAVAVYATVLDPPGIEFAQATGRIVGNS
jgi:hypothetical protein